MGGGEKMKKKKPNPDQRKKWQGKMKARREEMRKQMLAYIPKERKEMSKAEVVSGLDALREALATDRRVWGNALHFKIGHAETTRFIECLDDAKKMMAKL